MPRARVTKAQVKYGIKEAGNAVEVPDALWIIQGRIRSEQRAKEKIANPEILTRIDELEKALAKAEKTIESLRREVNWYKSH